MSAIPIIAIDGPSASGKGSVAARVAARLGFHHLDSGALYRLVALKAMGTGAALDDEAAVAALARALDTRFEGGMVLLDGGDVTDDIRSEACSSAASVIAAHPRVRQALLERQREFGEPPGLVAEGRDMGSVVFPAADLKIFLTASAEVRAERRYKQLIEKGVHANLPSLLQDLRARDARDASRSVAPLQQSPDAVLVDTSCLDLAQSVDAVLDAVRRQLPDLAANAGI